MGKASPPGAPDPTATAAAQGRANVSTAAAQSALNNVNQVTPYGSTTYGVSGYYTDPNGDTVPNYTETTALSPMGQLEQYQQQRNYSQGADLGYGLLQNAAAYSQPLNFDTAFSSTLNQGPQLLDQNTTNALYGQQKSFLDPQWGQQQKDLEDQLSRQGIPVGSAAYNSAMQNFNNSKTQAYQSAQDSAVGAGTQAASNIFNMALAGQGQDISQQEAQMQWPLAEYGQLMGALPQPQGQPIMQPSQSQVSPTDVIGAQGLSTQAQQAQYQAQVGQQNAMYGGMATIAASAAIAI